MGQNTSSSTEYRVLVKVLRELSGPEKLAALMDRVTPQWSEEENSVLHRAINEAYPPERTEGDPLKELVEKCYARLTEKKWQYTRNDLWLDAGLDAAARADVYTAIRKKKNREAALRLIFLLRMDLEETKKYLSLSRQKLDINNTRDSVLSICVNNKIWNREAVDSRLSEREQRKLFADLDPQMILLKDYCEENKRTELYKDAGWGGEDNPNQNYSRYRKTGNADYREPVLRMLFLLKMELWDAKAFIRSSKQRFGLEQRDEILWDLLRAKVWKESEVPKEWKEFADDVLRKKYYCYPLFAPVDYQYYIEGLKEKRDATKSLATKSLLKAAGFVDKYHPESYNFYLMEDKNYRDAIWGLCFLLELNKDEAIDFFQIVGQPIQMYENTYKPVHPDERILLGCLENKIKMCGDVNSVLIKNGSSKRLDFISPSKIKKQDQKNDAKKGAEQNAQ